MVARQLQEFKRAQKERVEAFGATSRAEPD